MPFPTETAQRICYGQEAAVLELARNFGRESAIAGAKAMMAGAANGLSRMDGPKQAAEEAYRVADRLAGQVRPHELDATAEAGTTPTPAETAQTFAANWWPWLMFMAFVAGFMIGST